MNWIYKNTKFQSKHLLNCISIKSVNISPALLSLNELKSTLNSMNVCGEEPNNNNKKSEISWSNNIKLHIKIPTKMEYTREWKVPQHTTQHWIYSLLFYLMLTHSIAFFVFIHQFWQKKNVVYDSLLLVCV